MAHLHHLIWEEKKTKYPYCMGMEKEPIYKGSRLAGGVCLRTKLLGFCTWASLTASAFLPLYYPVIVVPQDDTLKMGIATWDKGRSPKGRSSVLVLRFTLSYKKVLPYIPVRTAAAQFPGERMVAMWGRALHLPWRITAGMILYFSPPLPSPHTLPLGAF